MAYLIVSAIAAGRSRRGVVAKQPSARVLRRRRVRAFLAACRVESF